MTEERFAAFHTGRGGRFNNAGYRTFMGVYTEQGFINILDQKHWFFDKNRDKKGKFCKPYWHDSNGNFVAYVGDRVFDFDGPYCTYEIKPLNELDIDDFYIIFRDDMYIDKEVCRHISLPTLITIVGEFNKWKSQFLDVMKNNNWDVEVNDENESVICSDGVITVEFDKDGAVRNLKQSQ